MASITVSLPLNRWYFHYQYSAQFGQFSEAIGYANATFVSSLPPTAPSIVDRPADQTIVASGTAVFNAGAKGTHPLHYQWLFEGTNLLGATDATLTQRGP